MRIHKGTNWTTFSAVCGADALTMLLRRVFHPQRGEEVQLEVMIERGATTKAGGERQRRWTAKAAANMTPPEAGEFAKVVLGEFKKAPAPSTLSPSLNIAMNAYQPVEYANKMSARETAICKRAFLDGYDYRESLGPDVKATGA